MRKTREGVVVSDTMQKTRVVRIERVYRHPRYERVIRGSKQLKAHDEANASQVGDRVLIEETRPLSKEKRWRIRQILGRAPRRLLGRNDDPAALDARRRRQLRGQEGPVHPGDGRRQQALRLAGRHRHRRRQGGGARRDREEGRGGAGRRGAHGQGSRGARTARTSASTATPWSCIKPDENPGGHPHLRAGGPRAARARSSPRSSRWRPRSSDARGRDGIAHVRRGDTVAVIAGRERGKRGKVLRVLPDKGRVVVETINMVKKHQRPTQKLRQGGIIEREGAAGACPTCCSCATGATSRPGSASRYSPTAASPRLQACGESIDKGDGHGGTRRRQVSEGPERPRPPGAARPRRQQARPRGAGGAGRAGRRQARPKGTRRGPAAAEGPLPTRGGPGAHEGARSTPTRSRCRGWRRS